ncbi:MAG TPA: replicative DNA helicase [Firmicutes bacterium]|nr:replicative DNA helicase [Bacillota bacterium]HHY98930.1 replicative DNA helicase [Bacillota bacterium]
MALASTSAVFDRMPPQNIEAEQSTLGSMLLDKDAIATAFEILLPEDFYKEAHRLIYEAILSLYDKGQPVDVVTVTEQLRRQNALEKVGGASYITTLVNFVPTAANVGYYARIVKDKSILRSLVTAGTEIAAIGYEAQEDVESALDMAEQLIFRIAQKRGSEGVVDIKSVLIESFERIEYLYAHKGGVTGVPSGFMDLDQLTSGFQPSDVIIVAARPSMGKTTFALNIAEHVAVREKIPVLVFSLEMSREQVAQKMLCSAAGVDNQRLRTGFLKDSDWSKLSNALGVLSEAPIFIDDTPGISVMELRAKARRTKAQYGLGLVIVDYLQLLHARNRSESRQQEVSEISRALKSLAKELNVPVIALSQLSRAAEQNPKAVPRLANLRESGSLEQDSDVVIFLYREDYYEQETENKDITEVIIAKQRNGPTGSIKLLFQKEFSRFANIELKRSAG